MYNYKMNSLVALLAIASTSDAFTMQNVHRSNISSVSTIKKSALRPSSLLKMASVEDEVAALRVAAQKARDDASRLSKELGKDEVEEESTKTQTVVKEPETLSPNQIKDLVSAINFENEDAQSQVSKLSGLSESAKLGLWNAARTSSANTNSPAPLRPYPVSLNFLEQRTGGKITAESLGVGGGDDVTLDDFKYATLYVVGGSSIAGVASLAFLPENIGAAFCYLFAIIPILFLGIGSTAPAAIAGAIASVRGTSDDQSVKEDRICRHEAGHFLCGYLSGLPVRSYQINDLGFPCVEFYPSTDGEAMGRELSQEEIAIMSVVAMSGSVAEALEFGEAKGGQNDLIELDNLYKRSKEFIGAQKQQDLTRWGALASYNMIISNKDKYESLVSAFREKKTVSECIAAIEGQTV
mmetsp:Transcript_15097/g.17238  ORF Transcript_15097/g.17238 Transcript_15097/m.17238 type:complete len:410 (-) Transcript_15097:114-1343(-)